jgi:NAD(P)-dependent dehydrogenase (short-subunit alcohol dehydrogenase family)
MDLQLESKTALVSGSSQGIGFAIAEALAREGATVVINSNKQKLVDQAVDRLTKIVPGVQLVGAVADLATAEGVQDLIRKVPAVDILVNSVARGIAETTTGTAVTVNSVLPGPTRSEGVEAFIQQMVTSRSIPAEQAVDEFFKTVRPTSILPTEEEFGQ